MPHPATPPEFTDGLIWYSTRAATVGLIVRAGVVADGPPYVRGARWNLLGRPADGVWSEARRRGADLVWLPDQPA